MPARIDAQYVELESYLSEVEKVFVQPFLPVDPAVGPEVYKFHVTAYCVLAHAAFEEYVEDVALRVVSESIKNYVNSSGNKINKSLVALTLFFEKKVTIDEDEDINEVRFFDRFRNMLSEIKTSYSNDIYKNHGVSIKYLRKMLVPIAIDIKDDAILKNSLKQLANARGTYAHKKISEKFLAPEDAVNYVKDCLALSQDIRDKAKLVLCS